MSFQSESDPESRIQITNHSVHNFINMSVLIRFTNPYSVAILGAYASESSESVVYHTTNKTMSAQKFITDFMFAMDCNFFLWIVSTACSSEFMDVWEMSDCDCDIKS
jgi:hypothetical protein